MSNTNGDLDADLYADSDVDKHGDSD